MTHMVSRWPVLVRLPTNETDLDTERRITHDGVERVFAFARRAYLDESEHIAVADVQAATSEVRLGGATISGDVIVSTGVTEIFPDSFVMSARIVPAEDEGLAAEATCTLRYSGELPKAAVDEFIARAHAARYIN